MSYVICHMACAKELQTVVDTFRQVSKPLRQRKHAKLQKTQSKKRCLEDEKKEDDGTALDQPRPADDERNIVSGQEDQLDICKSDVDRSPFPESVGCHSLRLPLLEQALSSYEEQRQVMQHPFPIDVDTLKNRFCSPGYSVKKDEAEFQKKAKGQGPCSGTVTDCNTVYTIFNS